MRKIARKATGGFSLIELMVATFILTVGLVALLGTFLSGLLLVDNGRDMGVAAADARAVFEEMRRVSSGGIAAVTNPPTAWSAWARGQGLTTLDNETVSEEFYVPGTNRAARVNRLAPPETVEAVVTIRWQERGRPYAAEFTHVMTKR